MTIRTLLCYYADDDDDDDDESMMIRWGSTDGVNKSRSSDKPVDTSTSSLYSLTHLNNTRSFNNNSITITIIIIIIIISINQLLKQSI